jgi:hypothetical protein
VEGGSVRERGQRVANELGGGGRGRGREKESMRRLEEGRGREDD